MIRLGLAWLILCVVSCHSQPTMQAHVDKLVKPNQEQVLQALLAHDLPPVLEDLVVFGDSLSDTGRLRRRTLDFYIPPEIYWKGRLTNGPNWTDYVCGAFPCNSHNYAVAGASTRLGTIPIRWVVRPLDLQIQDFFDENPKLSAGKSSAVIWIGPNNYIQSIKMNPEEARNHIREAAMGLLEGPIDRLMIGNMPQLAGLLDAPGTHDPTPLDVYRNFTAEHNRMVGELISELQKRFPKKGVALFDASAINDATIKRPQDYGFTSLTEACYKGDYRGHFHGAAAFCPQYLAVKFWDYVHPNSRMHCYYAAQFILSMQQAGWLPSVDGNKAMALCKNL